jgi:hypothetical protein
MVDDLLYLRLTARVVPMRGSGFGGAGREEK